MDLLAPNPAIMRTGFIQLGIVIVMLIVGAVKRSTATEGIGVWLKLNAPLVSLILSELWAVMGFALNIVAAGKAGPAPTIDEFFVVGLWMAGGTSLIAGIVKDAADGSIVTASRAGVERMRRKNATKGGVGG